MNEYAAMMMMVLAAFAPALQVAWLFSIIWLAYRYGRSRCLEFGDRA